MCKGTRREPRRCTARPPGGGGVMRTPIERATPNDMLQLTYDGGSVLAQVGAV